MASRPAPSEKDKKRFQRAMQLHEQGQSKEALRLFDKVRKSWGDDPDIWYLIGLAHGNLGQMREAERVSRNALMMQPDHFGALCNLANAQMALGNREEALINYRKSLAVKPNEPTVLDNYGRALGMLGRREEAVEQFRKILRHNPDYAPAHAGLGQALVHAGDAEQGFDEFQAALRLDPNQPEAHLELGRLYTSLGNMPVAEQHMREAIRIKPGLIDAHIGLANTLRHRGSFSQALDTLDKAMKLAPRHPHLLATRANVLQYMGKSQEAYDLLMDLNERRQIPAIGVAAFARICRDFDACDEALDLIRMSVDSQGTHAMEKQMLRFMAGDLQDKLKHYEEAFEWYRAANDVDFIPYNAEQQKELIDTLISSFSKDAMGSLPRATTDSTRPIFILGMPRSGTTLTEQILDGHEDVHGAGELTLIKDCVNELQLRVPGQAITKGSWATHLAELDEVKMTELANRYLTDLGRLNSEAKYVTDKMPHNFLAIGLINLLFPKARIIHCRRNPLDTGLSIYFQNFVWTHDYATDLRNIGLFYNEYRRLMQHWEEVIDIPMLNVDYEDMIEDPEGSSRKILDFCGLEWQDSVMDFHKSGRTVATASFDQVRQPIYKTSRARWKNYEKHIGPLRDALAEQGPDGTEN